MPHKDSLSILIVFIFILPCKSDAGIYKAILNLLASPLTLNENLNGVDACLICPTVRLAIKFPLHYTLNKSG